MDPPELSTCILLSTLLFVLIITICYICYIIYFWIYGYYGSVCIEYIFIGLDNISKMFSVEWKEALVDDGESTGIPELKQCKRE